MSEASVEGHVDGHLDKYCESITNSTLSPTVRKMDTTLLPSIIQTPAKDVRFKKVTDLFVVQSVEESLQHTFPNDVSSGMQQWQTSRDGGVISITLRPFSSRELSLPSIHGSLNVPTQLINPYSPTKPRSPYHRLPNVRGAIRDTNVNKELTATSTKMSLQPGILKSNTTLGFSSSIGTGTTSGVVNGIIRRQTHPYLSTHQDSWRPKITRDATLIQLEKRAKVISDVAIKVSFNTFRPQKQYIELCLFFFLH